MIDGADTQGQNSVRGLLVEGEACDFVIKRAGKSA